MRFWDYVESKYLPELLSFLDELKRRSYMVIACKGVCTDPSLPEKQALRVAKSPINIPKEYKYKFAEADLRLTEDTIARVRKKEALAFGLPGAPNKLLILDVDTNATFIMAALQELERITVDEEVLKQLREVIQDLDAKTALDRALSFLSELGIDLDRVYVETTPRGGMHIILKMETVSDYHVATSIPGAKGYIDNKVHGYVVAYPSILAIKRVVDGREGYEVFQYEKTSSVEVWETDLLPKYIKAVTRLVQVFTSLTLVYEFSTESEKREYKYVRVPDTVAEIVAKLPLELALRYFFMCCVAAGCGECVKYYIEKLLRNEPWEVTNITYPVRTGRGLHFVLENELFGAMWLLGFSEDQLYTVAELVKYKDYEPETPPIEAAKNIIRYKYRWLSIARPGLCPFLLANELHGRYYKPSCVSKLTLRISNLVESKLGIVVHILRHVIKQARTAYANKV